MYKLLFILCLWIGCAAYADAKTPPVKKAVQVTVPKVLHLDSSKVAVRNFNAKALERYLQDPNFNYTDKPKTESLWDRFWRFFWNFIHNLFGSREPSKGGAPSPVITYLLLALITGLLIYVVIRIIGLDNIFNRESRSIQIPYSESLENIHEITFDEQIERALAAHNYKLAVRLLYLRSLKQLSDAGLIHWQMEKTNAAYINELANSDHRQSFGILTRQFEYVWYGDFPVDGQSFQHINAQFHDFKNRLS